MQTTITSQLEIETILIKIIKSASIEDPDCIVTPTTVPKRDIKGFDSLMALEVLTELEEETGIHVEENVFYLGAKPRRYLLVHDVASAIWGELQKEGKNYA